MKKENIGLERENIGDLLQKDSGIKFIIPKYQRVFSWNKNDAEKMFDDVESILKGEDNDYFLGTIVLNTKRGSTEDEVQIIDGQQRITTVSLLIFALYLIYRKNVDISNADKHIYKYIKAGDIDDEYQILTLSRNNEDFYSSLIKEKEISNIYKIKSDNVSNKKIFEVLCFFIEKLQEDKENDKELEKNRLNNILKNLRKKIFFITIAVPNYSEASKIFEVLNNRGVDLSKADLIKNFILPEAEKQEVLESVENNWNLLEDNVGIDNLERFFRYFSFIFSELNDLYDRVVFATNKTSAKTISDIFKKSSFEYQKFLDPDNYEEEGKKSELLSELKNLGVTQCYSLLLAGNLKYSKNDYIELIEFIVKFTFRYTTICSKNPNKVEKLYANLAYLIYNENKTLNEVKSKIGTLLPSENEFKDSFLNSQFKNTKIPRYILGKIENAISSGEKIIDFSSVHLEHIMPKKIDKWVEEDVIYKEIHPKYINSLGNMVLLSEKINTSIKNGIFSEKLEKYKDSEINIMSSILKKNEWKAVEIEERLDYYYENAKEIWKINT